MNREELASFAQEISATAIALVGRDGICLHDAWTDGSDVDLIAAMAAAAVGAMGAALGDDDAVQLTAQTEELALTVAPLFDDVLIVALAPAGTKVDLSDASVRLGVDA